jgi:hypothetical protein
MLIYNTTNKEVHAVAFGNHFNIPAGKIKSFNDDIGDFLAKNKRYLGLVALPETFDDMEYRASDEGKASLEEYRKQGIAHRVQYLESIKYNLLVSLKKDLDVADMKVDPKVFASPGEMAAMQELLEIKAKHEDANAEKVKQLEILEKKLEKLE